MASGGAKQGMRRSFPPPHAGCLLQGVFHSLRQQLCLKSTKETASESIQEHFETSVIALGALGCGMRTCAAVASRKA